MLLIIKYSGLKAVATPKSMPQSGVAVKELKFSSYIGETLLFTIYTHYGNLNPKP